MTKRFLLVLIGWVFLSGSLWAQPTPPGNFRAIVGDRSAILRWDATDPATLGYYVYWSTNPTGPFTARTSVMQTSAVWVDVSVSNDKTYYYAISAVNTSFEEGAMSTPFAVTPHTQTDEAFLDMVQHAAFDFFWYEANPNKGLIRDRNQKGSAASIASSGFGLAGIGIGIERGWITREQGVKRVLNSLRFLASVPTQDKTNSTGYKGFYYHFLNTEGGYKTGDVELSTIDTGLLLMGVLFAKEYFTGNSADEIEIRALATEINNRVEWTWAMPRSPRIVMGWKPDTGFLTSDWWGYTEAMFMYIVALGSPTYPITASAWTTWTASYNWQTHYGYSFVIFPPLFGHQYTMNFIDMRDIKDSYMRTKGIDYHENTRRATLAQRAYCIQNPNNFTGYRENLWGITASDVPGGYAARGAPPNWGDDGTLVPTAPGGSFAHTPTESLAALREMYNQYRVSLWSAYGFKDAFHPGKNWFATDVIGIDQGPILLAIENYRTGLIWKTLIKNDVIQRGLRRAGFKGPNVKSEEETLPSAFAINSSYPNPFTDQVTISAIFEQSGTATLHVFDLLGRKLLEEVKHVSAGKTDWVVSLKNLPAGRYEARIQFKDSHRTIAMIKQ